MEGIEAQYESVDDVIEGLSALEKVLYERRDRRGVFTSAYLSMTKEIEGSVGEHQYKDGEWVSRYAVSFANLYRSAFVSFEEGDLDAVPKPWRMSFEASSAGRGLLLQDLLLGINAHINHDLPIALVDVTIDPNREQRRHDHFAVNQSIKRATDPVQDRISSLYAPVFRLLDEGFGRLDEDVTSFSIEKARLNAWVSAIALASAADDDERAVVREAISDRAGVMAKLILAPRPRGRLLDVVHRAERMTPWWRLLTNRL
jgi:hypothetical protein